MTLTWGRSTSAVKTMMTLISVMKTMNRYTRLQWSSTMNLVRPVSLATHTDLSVQLPSLLHLDNEFQLLAQLLDMCPVDIVKVCSRVDISLKSCAHLVTLFLVIQ